MSRPDFHTEIMSLRRFLLIKMAGDGVPAPVAQEVLDDTAETYPDWDLDATATYDDWQARHGSYS